VRDRGYDGSRERGRDGSKVGDRYDRLALGVREREGKRFGVGLVGLCCWARPDCSGPKPFLFFFSLSFILFCFLIFVISFAF
jgi:hypothetical protein